ncbi:MAG: hypothetical protein EP335_05610 [Alphaproteobacteria bacterium]|nr:MAG: hypothetical protein EP335_05610 [Alphaproteobacteria bacterium]
MFGFICAARRVCAAAVFLALPLLAGGGAEAQNFTVKVMDGQPLQARAGETGQAQVSLSLDAPWYIYAPTGINESQGVIETRLVMRPTGEIQFAPAAFPPAEGYGAYDVLRGKDNLVTQAFRVRPRTPAGDYKVQGYVEYQTCDGTVCLPPDRVAVSFFVHVTD